MLWVGIILILIAVILIISSLLPERKSARVVKPEPEKARDQELVEKLKASVRGAKIGDYDPPKPLGVKLIGSVSIGIGGGVIVAVFASSFAHGLDASGIIISVLAAIQAIWGYLFLGLKKIAWYMGVVLQSIYVLLFIMSVLGSAAAVGASSPIHQMILTIQFLVSVGWLIYIISVKDIFIR
jgi:hypothetical protein